MRDGPERVRRRTEWGWIPMALRRSDRSMLSMTTILVRCSVHAQLSHEAFFSWLERRRCRMSGEAGVLGALEARQLGDHELVIELDCEPPYDGDTELDSVVQDFVVDLQLMGMSPTVYVPSPTS